MCAIFTHHQLCTGTVCAALSLQDCECNTEEQACHVCCILSNGTCASTITITTDDGTTDLAAMLPGEQGRVLQVGFPCGNFTGYCDFFNRCMVIDSEGM